MSDDYQATLNKMADLTDLVSSVNAAAQQNVDKKQKIISLINDAKAKLNGFQAAIDRIKGEGVKAQAEILDLIKSASSRQDSVIQGLQETINSIADVGDLENQVALLKNDIDGLSENIGSLNPNAPEFVPGQTIQGTPTVRPGANDGNDGSQMGGYTYGKSRRNGRRRRRRGKKSRRKGVKKSKGKKN
jgi:hypothetical protein